MLFSAAIGSFIKRKIFPIATFAVFAAVGCYVYFQHTQIEKLHKQKSALDVRLSLAKSDLNVLSKAQDQSNREIAALRSQHKAALANLKSTHRDIQRIEQRAADFQEALRNARAKDKEFKNWADVKHGDAVNRLLNDRANYSLRDKGSAHAGNP